MTLPVVFGGLTTTSGSLSLLDQNFNALGAISTVVGTVSGTNAIVFTGATNNPAIAAYANYMRFGFVATATSNGSVTFRYGALAALNVYGADGTTQLGSGDITINRYYELVYNSALNSSAGGFVMVSLIPSTNISTPVTVANGGTGDSSLTAFALMAGGTSSTSPVQSLAGLGTSGQILTSNGAGALPTFQAAASTGLSSKLVSFTRDAGASSGNQAVTGVGFQPTSIKFMGAKNSTSQGPEGMFNGLSDSSKSGAYSWMSLINTNDGGGGTTCGAEVGAQAIGITDLSTAAALPSAKGNVGTINSYDSDGFTIAWVKNGSPSAQTWTIYALCEK